MWQLVINTSHHHLSLALLKDGVFFDGINEIAFKTQSELIMVRLDELIKRNNIHIFDVNELYIGIGPGSYTGVRIGLTVVKVLAILNKFDVYTFTSFDFALPQDFGTSIMDARSSRAYVGIKEDSKWVFQGILTIDELKERMIHPLVGDTSLVNCSDESKPFEELCEHILKASTKVRDVHSIEPLYIKTL
jgi:tRNA threonylcarbamoyladenosine biosynthesis protein TsaB